MSRPFHRDKNEKATVFTFYGTMSEGVPKEPFSMSFSEKKTGETRFIFFSDFVPMEGPKPSPREQPTLTEMERILP